MNYSLSLLTQPCDQAHAVQNNSGGLELFLQKGKEKQNICFTGSCVNSAHTGNVPILYQNHCQKGTDWHIQCQLWKKWMHKRVTSSDGLPFSCLANWWYSSEDFLLGASLLLSQNAKDRVRSLWLLESTAELLAPVHWVSEEGRNACVEH